MSYLKEIDRGIGRFWIEGYGRMPKHSFVAVIGANGEMAELDRDFFLKSKADAERVEFDSRDEAIAWLELKQKASV